MVSTQYKNEKIHDKIKKAKHMSHRFELLVSSSPALIVKEENSTANEVGQQTRQSNSWRQVSFSASL